MGINATARRVGASLEHEIDVNGRHTILTDEPEYLGGDDLGATPHELLAAAVAGCVSTMIAMYARRKEWELGELAVEVDFEPETDPPTFAATIAIERELSDDQIQRLGRVARTCPARRSLESDPEFRERFIVGNRRSPQPSA
jgi:putative redox protein